MHQTTANPFPGMNPFLEDPANWEEFHHVFITELMYQLSARLPDLYNAMLRVRIHDATLGLREGYVEIVRQSDNEVITSIELVSLANKPEGREFYAHKRRAMLNVGAHVIEIDLLLQGTRTKWPHPLPDGDYFAMVFRADLKGRAEVYPWTIRNRLPTIALPLTNPGESLALDLQEILTTGFDRGHYDRKVRYHLGLPVAVNDSDAAWIDEVLRKAGKRK